MLPILLTRRDELFPLARQVVRDSGYQYSKGHSRSQFASGFPSKLFDRNISSVAVNPNGDSNDGMSPAKKQRISGSSPGPGQFGHDSAKGDEELKRRKVRQF